MRVLSRRSNLPKAVACGYCEGAGFVVLTEPSPWPLALLLWVRCTTRRRGVGELCPSRPRGCAHSAASTLGWATTGTLNLAHQQRPRRRRRGGDESSRRRRQGGVPSLLWHLGAAKSAVRRPSAEAEKARGDGVECRPKTPPDGVGERSPAPATAAAALWFQSQRQRQWALLADNETALQHGCGDDCSPSASLAALRRATASAALSAVANASSTSLAHKACV